MGWSWCGEIGDALAGRAILEGAEHGSSWLGGGRVLREVLQERKKIKKSQKPHGKRKTRMNKKDPFLVLCFRDKTSLNDLN